MDAAESMITIYRGLETLLGPRKARESLSAILKNYLTRLEDDDQPLNEIGLVEFLRDQAKLYN